MARSQRGTLTNNLRERLYDSSITANASPKISINDARLALIYISGGLTAQKYNDEILIPNVESLIDNHAWWFIMT